MSSITICESGSYKVQNLNVKRRERIMSRKKKKRKRKRNEEDKNDIRI